MGSNRTSLSRNLILTTKVGTHLKWQTCTEISLLSELLGSFSNDDGDGIAKVKEAIDLCSKTTTLHVHRAFLYISLPSPHNYDVKTPNFTCYRGRKQATTNFSFSF